MIKVIVSDLGNVLLFYDHSVLAEKLSGQSLEDIENRVLYTDLDIDFHEGRISAEDFYRRVSTLLGLNINMEEFRDAYNSIFTEPNTELINFLAKAKGSYRLVLLSDTNEMHLEYIRGKYPFLEMFDELVFSNEIGFTKYRSPKRMFSEVVRRAGCLPEECLLIDDKEWNVSKARENGLEAIQFTGNEQLFRDMEKLGISATPRR